MRDGICPKCNSNEIIGGLMMNDTSHHPPYVQVVEPTPENTPLLWIRKSEQSNFLAYVCGVCGYTEFYAANHQKLLEGVKRGFLRA